MVYTVDVEDPNTLERSISFNILMPTYQAMFKKQFQI